jgi:hypothetical protein
MPTAETAFIAKVREQIRLLEGDGNNYDGLRVYVTGIGEPWVFGPYDEFDLDDEVLVVRDGPTEEEDNEGMPEYVFPIRHVVATELAVSEDEE